MDDETAVRRSILDLRRLLHCMEHGDDRGLASPSILLRAQLAQDLFLKIQHHCGGAEDASASTTAGMLGELQPRVEQACRTARDVARMKKEHEIDHVDQIFFPTKLALTEPEDQHRTDRHDSSNKQHQQQQQRAPTQPEQSVQEIQADQRDQLEEEISHMAAQLKASTVRMNQSLKSQTQELDEMGLLAEQNVQEVGQAANNVNEHLKSSWGSTIATWTMIATVFGTFFFAMITMRMIPKRANVCLPFFCQNPIQQSRRRREVDDEPWEAPCLFYCTQIPECFGRTAEQACHSLSNMMGHQFICPEIKQHQYSAQDLLPPLNMESSSTNSQKHRDEMRQRREKAASADRHVEGSPRMDDSLSRVVKRREELRKRREAAASARELADVEHKAMDDAPQQDVCLGDSCAASSLYDAESETTLPVAAETVSSEVSAVADPVPLHLDPAVESSVNTLEDIDHAITEDGSSTHGVHSETFSSNEGGPPLTEEIEQVYVPETEPVLECNRRDVSAATLSCNVDQIREFVTTHPSLVMEPDENGWTIFTECVASGCTDGALFILDTIPGLDVNSRTSNAATALWWAQARRHPSDHEIFKVIGSRGGIIAGPGVERPVENTEPIEEITPPIEEIAPPIEEEKPVEPLDFDDTKVRAAAYHGDIRLLSTLLDRAPQFLDAADGNGWRPIHEAVRNGQFSTVHLLVTRGADLNARTGRQMEGSSPLAMANEFLGVDSEVYQLLKSHGAQ
jgi:Membrane fusion protein Use1/Ankyrin repeats (many copies)